MENLTKKFETRKRVTGKALSDLYEIFKEINRTVDSMTVITDKTIRCRTCEKNWSNDGEDFYIEIKEGLCGLWYYEHTGYKMRIDKDYIEYINLEDVTEGLQELFENLKKVSTREDEGKKISSILEMLK